MERNGTYLGGGDHAVGVHDPVRIFLSDLGDEKSSHARPSASTQGVSQLEALETVASLRLLPHHVKNGVDQLSAYEYRQSVLKVQSIQCQVRGVTSDLRAWLVSI